jgi:hypothetical protein
MLRLATLAFCLAAFAAATAPAHALNPQPLPPGPPPCLCDRYQSWNYKQHLLMRRLILKQGLAKSRLALVR